jgi:hypothetical protein
MKFLLPVILVLFTNPGARSQNDSAKTCDFSGNGYEHLLDGYFARARGNSPSAVILRVYGGLEPEYEIVLNPDISSHTISWYAPKKILWGISIL